MCTVPGTAASSTLYSPPRFASFHLACPSALLSEKNAGGALPSWPRLSWSWWIEVPYLSGQIDDEYGCALAKVRRPEPPPHTPR